MAITISDLVTQENHAYTQKTSESYIIVNMYVDDIKNTLAVDGCLYVLNETMQTLIYCVLMDHSLFTDREGWRF